MKNPGTFRPAAETAWHTHAADAVARHFKVVTQEGLTPDEVDTRLAHSGPNVIREKPGLPAWRVLLDQFANFMILVLLAAAVVSGVVGDTKDAIAILVIVILNALIGFAQTMRAEQAMAALKRMAGTSAQVLRAGQIVQIPSANVVPGDILLLEAGQVVSADVRLIEVAQLKVDESALTGEAVPVDKATTPLDNAQLPLGDRENMAFKGTVVTYGRGTGIVVATGMDSELGKVADLLDSAEEPATPLQKRLAVFGQRLAIAILGICSIFVVTGLLRGEPIMLVLLTGISLAVAAIPEALPAVVTISLALGARKMVRQNALIRRLPAVETLGSVTYICSDKTGTLTQNRMEAAELRTMSGSITDARSVPADDPWPALMTGLCLCNDASRHADGNVIGDPTEVALFNAAFSAGYDKTSLSACAPRVFELPFDSDRKRMTTFHQKSGGIVAYTKGAPESVLPRCHAAHGLPEGGAFDADTMLAAAEQMAADGMRVLALAQRPWDSLPDPDSFAVERIESMLEFTGLVGLIDPARAEAQEAIALCRSAGIRPVMITGDHPATAQAIARQLGMTSGPGSVMTGLQLAAIDDETFAQSVTDIEVYARVDPAQKIRIVQALQADGEFVAMTGDGVNDAPALKRADIGVAMGKGGTDVAREAASLILLDDNFATIVKAVREGRRIFDNIRKFIRYAMTGNSAEILTLFVAPFLGLPIPLLPIHLLWINLLTDGLPGLALAVEPAEKGTMQRPPRPPNESVFAHGMWQSVVVMGSLIAALCLTVQFWAIHLGDAHWQTMVFTQLTLSQLALVMAIRVEWDSVFTQGVFRNRALLGAVLLSFVLQLATIYVPLLNPVFNTAPLTLAELSVCIGLSALVFLLAELEKLLMRRGLLFYARRDARPHPQRS